MKIVSLLEDKNFEKRIAVTPDIAKKYTDLGFELLLPENYGKHLGFEDDLYKNVGVAISKDENDLLTNADLIIQLGLLPENKLQLIKEGQTLIGVLNPYDNKEILQNLAKKKINLFSLEKLPRITRAQSMDILSSQANLAGYKAVVDSFENL